MTKERRCNLFDDNGKPRRLKDGTKGCFRDASACHFAHPHERTWKAAHPSFPPRHDLVADSDSEFFYILAHSDGRDRERVKEKDRGDRTRETEGDMHKKQSSLFLGSPPHRRDSTATRPSPGASSRRSTFDSPVDGVGAAKRGRSPALSSSSDQLERLRKDIHRAHDHPPPPRGYVPSSSRRSRSRSGDKDSQSGIPGEMPLPGILAPDSRNTSAQHPSTLPPEPPKPPPRFPEIPEVPSFALNEQTASSTGSASKGLKELSMDEQRSAWHERIDLMFTSITTRRDYSKLESDLSHIRLLSSSSLVKNMPEADRAHVNAQKAELERKMEVKRKEINETIHKLIGSNFWPVLKTPQISDMEKALEEAKKHVLEVRSLLDDVKSSCAALFKASTPNWTPDSDRHPKRRRLEGGADTPGQTTSGNAEVVLESTVKELEAFRDRLTELDRHLVDLENDITQRDAVTADEIELQIDARLDEEHALYSPVREPGEIFGSEIEAIVDAKNQELVRAVALTGEEIGVLAVEVAELITKVDALEARCTTLEAENQEFKNRLAQDSLNHVRFQDALVRRDKEIEAIAAALQAYISQSTAGQTTGEIPSAEYIIESLGSQLDSLFREKFSPTLVSIQREVFSRVQESHKRTLDTVSPRIMLLLKMVNLITARLGRPDSVDAMNSV